MNPLLTMSIVLVAGLVAGAGAKRLHIPSVTGQIIVGMLLGPSVANVLGHAEARQLETIVDFALGLMAVAVGSNLRLRQLTHAKRRLGLLLLCESTLTPVLVYLACRILVGASAPVAVLLAVISISTAPATILAIARESRARGVFTKTLLVAVALNNLACITLFELARGTARSMANPDAAVSFGTSALLAGRQLGLSLALGAGIGAILVALTRRVARRDRLTALSLVAILLVAGLAEHWGISTMLSCLFLGATLGNLTPRKEEIGHAVLSNLEYAIFAVFFTLAGSELHLSAIGQGGLLALAMFAARIAGKWLSASVAMRLAGATPPLRRLLGTALIPQAGLAVGLMLLVTGDSQLASIHDTVLAVVLTVVLGNELLGPVLTRFAIVRAGEANKDRPRVLDFLHEEHIVTNFRAATFEDAVRQLVRHLLRTRRIPFDEETLVATVLESERRQSTCLGEGLAVPHGRLPSGDAIVGVMGLAPLGLPLATPDGLPVRCIVLVLAPEGHDGRHLEVLASLVRAVGKDAELRSALCVAPSPAHAYDLLHAEESTEEFNHFVEDDAPRPIPATGRR